MSARHVRNPDTITMYGADWCGDCIRAKAFFTEHNMAFDYVDLIEFPDETEVVLEHNGGVQKIPLVIYPNGSFHIEPTYEQLELKRLELEAASSDDRSVTVVDNTEGGANREVVVVEKSSAGRFELHIDGTIVSVANYSESADEVVTITHVTTDPDLRGNGLARALMDGILDHLRTTERKISPACPFAARHLEEHPEHHDLVA